MVTYREPRWAGCADVVLPQEPLPSPSQAADEGCPALLPACRTGAVLTPVPASGHVFSPALLLPQPAPGEEPPAGGSAAGSCCRVPPLAAAPLSAGSGEGVQTPTSSWAGTASPFIFGTVPCCETAEALLSDVSQACGTV